MVKNTFPPRARLAGMLLALLALVLVTSACNTWHGAGKDVEKTGESMQRN